MPRSVSVSTPLRGSEFFVGRAPPPPPPPCLVCAISQTNRGSAKKKFQVFNNYFAHWSRVSAPHDTVTNHKHMFLNMKQHEKKYFPQR